jgi:hypothetical protein
MTSGVPVSGCWWDFATAYIHNREEEMGEVQNSISAGTLS